MLTPIQGVAYYGLCDADCLQLGQWTFTEIRVKSGDFDARTLGWPVLRFGPDGRAHVLAQNVFQLVYLTCPDGCALASNWEVTFLSGAYNAVTPGELDLHAYEWDLEVNADGRVMLGASGNRLTNPNMLAFAVWACTANCSALANWGGFYVNNNAGSGLDVVFDRQGLPAIIFSGKRATDGMGITAIARCIKPNDCFSSDANWSTQVVDTHAAMEAELPVGPFLPPGCGIGTLEWYPTAGRLLFDGANALRLFATGAAAAICRGNPQDYLDQWGTWRQRRDTDVWTFLYKARLVIMPAR